MKKSDNFNKDTIRIKGARVHNLKNIDLDIPKNKLVVITGVSGSGKSSLAFDTIYAEGRRRYVESLSSYARQFLGVMDKPDVDKIEGLSPAIAIDQKSVSKNPRSTVGTITEIYDYTRLLFARIGRPHCPKCNRIVKKQSASQIVDQILKIDKKEIYLLGPVVQGKKGEHRWVIEEIQRSGFIRVRVNGRIMRTEEGLELKLDKQKKHTIEVVADRVLLKDGLTHGKELRSRVADSVETALKFGEGMMIVSDMEKDTIYSERFACQYCQINIPAIEPRTFSFNSPFGACATCQGLGVKQEIDANLIMPNPRLSISEGAIFPWYSASHKLGRQSYYWWMLEELATKFDFSLNMPISELSTKIKEIILHGDKDGKFEGVIPNLERRWKETDSEWTREEIEKYMLVIECPDCKGKRLRAEALAVTIADKNIDYAVNLSLDACKDFFSNLQNVLNTEEGKIAAPICKEIIARLKFLLEVGLDYLTLARQSGTLSGGEAQRIRLATQIGSGLCGVIYILDEPSIGLHQRDMHRLIDTLKELRDLGNSVLVVEHDAQTMKSADWLVDIGPTAGAHGGKVIYSGAPNEIPVETLTGKYLQNKLKVSLDKNNDEDSKKAIVIKGASEHNLKNIEVKIPLGKFVCVSGVSGSGKSTLINDILAKALLKQFYHAKNEPGSHKSITGTQHINKVVMIDQSPIGRTPRSNPATYTGVFSPIRNLFSKTNEAKIRGYQAGRFSFNVKGGRCETCQGEGYRKIEMYFMPDMYVECEECHGARYNKEALEIEFKGKNISQVLDMSVEKAYQFFKAIPPLELKLKTLSKVGLSYMKLGQPATTLSGGEAQRIKLSSELSRRDTGRTLYILDEPTTGLHFDDIRKLLIVLRELVAKGNTVLVIEHNYDVLKSADWIIDLGPEGGEKGGQIVAEGTPESIKKNKKSYTGKYL